MTKDQRMQYPNQAAAIQRAMDALELSQGELARKAGVHQTQISKYVRGVMRPNADARRKVARALHKRQSSLFGSRFGQDLKGRRASPAQPAPAKPAPRPSLRYRLGCWIAGVKL